MKATMGNIRTLIKTINNYDYFERFTYFDDGVFPTLIIKNELGSTEKMSFSVSRDLLNYLKGFLKAREIFSK